MAISNGTSRMSPQEAKQHLAEDLRNVANDVQELLRSTGGQMSEKTRELGARVTASLETAQAACQELSEQAMVQARAVDSKIREKPYQAIGIALAAGLVFGFLLKRK